MTTRRRILRAVGAGTLGGLAGCIGGPPDGSAPRTGETPSSGTSPDPTTTADRVRGHLSLRNLDSADATVSIAVRRRGETEYDEGFVARSGVTSGVDFDVTGPGTYRVSATLDSGESADYEWEVPAGYDGNLVVVVTEERALDFEEALERSPCVAGDGASATLPYSVPGAEETFQPGNLVVEHDGTTARTVGISIGESGTTFFDCSYELESSQTVTVDAVTATAGDYRVVVAVAGGGRRVHTWHVPPADNWPQLFVRVTEGGEPVVGCGGADETRVSVGNPTSADRSVELALRRDGEGVARRDVLVPGNQTTDVGLRIPVGDYYTLDATSGAGTASEEIVECYCFDQVRTVVTLADDGPSIESTRKVCQ